MFITNETKLFEFFYLVDTFKVSTDRIEEMFNSISSLPIPGQFNKSFNSLKFKQLIDLQSKINDYNDLIKVTFETVYDINIETVYKMCAFDAIRVSLFARDELERISKLFQAIEYKPSSDEIKAGIKKISSGFFGTVDWYARRMGITNHDEVVELQWTTIYQCLKIDFDNNLFEKNYRKIMENKK